MKNFILPLVLIFTLMSCSEEEMKPDIFSGAWHFESPDAQLEISFKAVPLGNGIYNIENRSVIHPTIPPQEQDNNQIRVYDKFENGNGYGLIEITSRGYVYYKVSLIYNRFTEDGNMAVYDVQIEMPNEPFMVLNDQTFIKME